MQCHVYCVGLSLIWHLSFTLLACALKILDCPYIHLLVFPYKHLLVDSFKSCMCLVRCRYGLANSSWVNSSLPTLCKQEFNGEENRHRLVNTPIMILLQLLCMTILYYNIKSTFLSFSATCWLITDSPSTRKPEN